LHASLISRLAALTLAVSLAYVPLGCSSYQAYRKCGWHGCPGDAQITSQVEALLAQHTELQAPNRVYVQTSDGVVFLSGKVNTGLQRDTAGSVAKSAPGVRQVVNSIALSYEGH
jgi:osmotically-inducible protein OsmY